MGQKLRAKFPSKGIITRTTVRVFFVDVIKAQNVPSTLLLCSCNTEFVAVRGAAALLANKKQNYIEIMLFKKCFLGWVLGCGFPLWGLASVSPWQNRHPVSTCEPFAAASWRLLPPGGTFRGSSGSHCPQKSSGGGLSRSGGDPCSGDFLPLHLHWRMVAGNQWRTPWDSSVSLLALHRSRSNQVAVV